MGTSAAMPYNPAYDPSWTSSHSPLKPQCTLSAAASTGIPLRFCLHFLAPRVKTAPSEWSAGRAGGVLWARERGALPEPAARWSPPRSFKHPLESSARCHRARRPPVKVCRRRRPPAACRPPAPTTCARLLSPTPACCLEDAPVARQSKNEALQLCCMGAEVCAADANGGQGGGTRTVCSSGGRARSALSQQYRELNCREWTYTQRSLAGCEALPSGMDTHTLQHARAAQHRAYWGWRPSFRLLWLC